ncbi:hypothetical protein RND81_12G147300 [Saponaria officinalis]|uniref:CCHC-type domain-containing protein n=1 Tax=Saponaria officinalis TaxID=3572 RepID=A0AAW1HAM4_SAPOF
MPENTNSETSYRNPYDDPLYLSSSDFPGVQLVSTLFNGKNYMSWSRGVILALGTKNNQGFLDGTTSRPATGSAKLQQWIRSDNMVRCWILNAIEAGIKDGFLSSKSSKLLWEEIHERYGQTNGPLLFQLKKDLRNVSQENRNVAEYFTTLKRYWDDIEDLESIPECSCGVLAGCTCGILKKLLELASREKSLVLFTLKNKMLVAGTTGGQMLETCHFCGKRGHTKERCFRLHPEMLQQYQQQKGRPGTTNKFSANNVEVDVFADTPLEFARSFDVHKKVDPALVSAVYQEMMKMVNSPTAQKNSGSVTDAAINFAGNTTDSLSNVVDTDSIMPLDCWIIDSGATDHMTSEKRMFCALRTLSKPISVGLPDGTRKIVKGKGDVIIHPSIMLKDVLYLSDFKHNLISVQKLLVCTSFIMNFDAQTCVLQDPTTKKPVLVGHMKDGLFKLFCPKLDHLLHSLSHFSIHSANNVNVHSLATSICQSKSVDLLHARLGHTSLSKMQHLDVVDCGGMTVYECDTCVLAKMHQLPFQRSNNKALHTFDLVHMDLWGPFKTPTLSRAYYFLTVVDDCSRATWTFLIKDKT